MLKLYLTLLIATSSVLVQGDGQLLPSSFVIVGGWKYNTEKVTEILDVQSMQIAQLPKSASFKDFEDVQVSNAVALNTAEGPTFCGGSYSSSNYDRDNCAYFTDNGAGDRGFWDGNLLNAYRLAPLAIQMNNITALIIGGLDDDGDAQDSMEVVTADERVNVQQRLPFAIEDGCATKINNTHGLIMGGFQDRTTSSRTLYIDLTTFNTAPGPAMKQARSKFGCAMSGSKVVVAGGVDTGDNKLATTEILDLSQANPTWASGPDLPYRVRDFEMVESIRGILAIGGADHTDTELNSILRYSCNGNSCTWIKEELELIDARKAFTAIPLTFAPAMQTETNPLLKPLFDLLLALGYNCQHNAETSFTCEKV